MASKSKADRTHKPHGVQHYSPVIEKRIKARAIQAMTLSGVPSEMARAIVSTPTTPKR